MVWLTPFFKKCSLGSSLFVMPMLATLHLPQEFWVFTNLQGPISRIFDNFLSIIFEFSIRRNFERIWVNWFKKLSNDTGLKFSRSVKIGIRCYLVFASFCSQLLFVKHFLDFYARKHPTLKTLENFPSEDAELIFIHDP